MRRKDLVLRLGQTLRRRRATLRTMLDIHASMIAVGNHPVGDSIDAAVDCERDELDSQLAAVESRELAAIDAALQRLGDGVYGICEGCGKSIPAARLQAVPYARLCINCQREEERHRRGTVAPAVHWERVSDASAGDALKNTIGFELELASSAVE